MSQTVSLSLPDELVRRLDRFAQRLGNGTTRTGASVILLDEALREEEFVGIEFRNTAIGRQPYVKGTGMAVWEMILVARGFEGDVAQTADDLRCSPENVQAALNYFNAYPEEIEAALAENDRGEEGLRQMFPHLRVLTFPVLHEETPS